MYLCLLLLASWKRKSFLCYIKRIQDDVIHPGSFQLWYLSSLEKMANLKVTHFTSMTHCALGNPILLVGKMKDECSVPIKGFVGLKCKIQIFITEDNHQSKSKRHQWKYCLQWIKIWMWKKCFAEKITYDAFNEQNSKLRS